MRDGRLLAVAHGYVVTLEAWQTEDLARDLCARLSRNLTFAEWSQHIGQEWYHKTCLNLPDPQPTKGIANR